MKKELQELFHNAEGMELQYSKIFGPSYKVTEVLAHQVVDAVETVVCECSEKHPEGIEKLSRMQLYAMTAVQFYKKSLRIIAEIERDSAKEGGEGNS